ncbi:helix-turn-helix transcriptional regulator [Dyella subtropica]|uniref:helix-turn-helix transcriptional regulator n=1 Tax=Dyella subtropica TaxID=2992127 RepID=UPI00225A32EA|nr:AraC family transcriptional regulator [Dyella subtropica]
MQTVWRSSHFQVISQECKYPRGDCGYVQGGEPARFIFTRRGSFAMHAGGKTCFARPGQAVLLQKNVEYRVSHPEAEGCDCCTDVWFDDAVLDMLGLANTKAQPCQAFAHDLHFQKTHVQMLLSLRHGGADPQEADEVLLDTLEHLLPEHASIRPHPRGASIARQVARVEEAIIGHTGENLSIHELAKLAGCSSFHLCRIFRNSTGQSLRQFRLQQRLGTALGRLGEGEEDLAALACDVGFSSHSHMTDAFRQALGMSPREMREHFRRSDLHHLRARLATLSPRRHPLQ